MSVIVPLVFYGVLAFGAFLVVSCIWGLIAYFQEQRKLTAAWREYDELVYKHGYDAKEHCPHRVVEFGQTGVAGVITMTTKWCKTCKKHLGSAKLVESFWGNRWE